MYNKEEIIRQLGEFGITNFSDVYYNYNNPKLLKAALSRGEGELSVHGPLVVRTGHHTGRSPNDKFIVDEPSSTEHIWWGDVNRPISTKNYEKLFSKVSAYVQRKELFVTDVFAGWNKNYRIPVRIISESAWSSLFANHLFVTPTSEELNSFTPEYTILHMPKLHANPNTDGTNSDVFVVVNFGEKTVLIGGTEYAGEIKKSVFTIMNYTLPRKGVMSMHCSANIGEKGDSAVLFGLSGTGKTTLSADPKRMLIGDDEHGWSDDGIFNIEGGCYAKVINLSEKAEPQIYSTTRQFGTILENVVMDPETSVLDLDDNRYTENTRAAYPLTAIANVKEGGVGGHPENIIMLTADAFGVLPPISKLTREQAMYHFLSGYTAKVAGTEKGVTEPKATFSTCFGAPFMALNPSVYADLLGEKITKHGAKCWLINTGWTGGPYGKGHRMEIAYTRAMLNAALDGTLDEVETKEDPIFGLHVPVEVPGVPSKVLDPSNTWESREDYDTMAKKLAEMFNKNFRQFENSADESIRNAGPNV